jgi:F-type H+-transporting ATPase subunit b
MYLAEPAGLLVINATFWIELVAFLLMLAILARYVYPRVIAAAEARQKAISEELTAAEQGRKEAEAKLQQAEKQLEDARAQAQEIIAGAGRSADQLREELKVKAEEEAKRVLEKAREEIAAERQKMLEGARRDIAELVLEATEKVIGETLDGDRHKKLIDKAIAEVGSKSG